MGRVYKWALVFRFCCNGGGGGGFITKNQVRIQTYLSGKGFMSVWKGRGNVF